MKLSDYLSKHKITQDKFLDESKRLGGTFSKHAISKWCQDKRIPRKEEMQIIYEVTGGLVTANDFYDFNVLPDKSI
tara:strand:- start:3940 stop:4167 length:228 start_codon:yes stop_codon:yes gene_type:complete